MTAPINSPSEDMAQAANLLAHPAAGAMALSAMGFGMASHAVGSWAGAMMVAAEASQRFWAPFMVLAEASTDTHEHVAPVARTAEKAAGNVVPIGKLKSVREPKPEKPVEIASALPVTKAVPDVAPAASDDLKVISGIGPKMEQVLNGIGVRSYEQIASWGDKDIAKIEDALGFRGRVGRDDWVGQAAALVRQSRTASGSEG